MWQICLRKYAHAFFLSKEALKQIKKLYCGLIRPVLEYGCTAWIDMSKGDMLLLEGMQLEIARAALHLPKSSLWQSTLQLINPPTLPWRRRLMKLWLFWKLLHGDGSSGLREKIPQSVRSRTAYNLRTNTVGFPISSTAKFLSSYIPSCVALWNTLPDSFMSASCLSAFKRLTSDYFSSSRFTFGLS